MATYTSSSQTELKEKVNAPQNAIVGGVYQRVFSFTIPATAGATDTSELTDIVIPAGTVVLSCTTYSSAANGNSTTLAFSTTSTGAVFGAATAYAASTWKTQAVTTPLVTTTADETVTVTNAVGAPSVATTITVSLVCASLGAHAAGQTTYTI